MAWQKVKLGDVCAWITSGGTPLTSKPDYYSPKEIPWLKTQEVNYCRIYQTNNHISKKGLENSSAKLIPANAVIVAMYGQGDTAGRVAINKIPLCTNQACCNLIIDENKADYEFIYYNLCTLYDKLVSLKNGGAQPNLNAGLIKNLEISLPPLKEQKRIADILSAYDNLIENNQKQIKLLEEAAQRLYKQWFIDLRYPGHETTKIVDGLPEGWHYKPVNSIVSLLSGYAFKSDSFSENGRYKIVTIKNVQDGVFDGENVSLVDDIPPKMPTHCVLNNGDVLLSLTGNVGRVCMVVGENYLLNQRVAKLKSDYPSFTYCIFRSKDMYDEMNNLANGAAQQNLSPIRTGQIKIAVPPSDILELFENEVNPIIAKILLLNKQNKSLSQSRDRLLPKLMNGELEV